MPSILQGECDLESALQRILPSQRSFIGAEEKFAAYVGGFGSGKSVALCLSAILRGRSSPGGLSLVGRATIPSLKDTTRRTFLELFPTEWLAPDGDRSAEQGGGRVIMDNGHEFIFRHLDLSDPNLKAHIRSLNLSSFYIDEASEVSEQTYFTLVGRLRRQNVNFRCGRICSNPAGHDWMWRLFFDKARPSKKVEIHKGILAATTENTNLPPDYVQDMLNVYPADWAERYIYASFADFSDKIYKDWDDRVHTYDDEQDWEVFGGTNTPPAEWPVIVGVDFGGIDPWAVVFIAIQPETGNLYLFDEIYQSTILVKDVAERYFAIMEGRRLDGMAYDYENQQAAMELAEVNIPGARADKSVDAGIFKVGQYLHPDKRVKHPFNPDAPSSPRLFIAKKCKNSIHELSSYSWQKDRAGNFTGRPQDGNDHTCDAIRYAIHTFRPLPQKMKPREKWQNPQLDEASRLYWYALNKAEKRQDDRRRRPVFQYKPLLIR